MKILLLYNTFLPEVHWNCLKAQEKNMGAIPPLNLCYIAALIRNAGHDVRILDLQVEPLSFEKTIDFIRGYQPDLLGFTITTYLFHGVLTWIADIKKAVAIPVLVGGFHMQLYPEETMAHGAIDFAILGYAGETLKQFLDHFGDTEYYKNIPGLCYRDGDGVHINGCDKAHAFDPDLLPFPARDLLKNERYGNFICTRKNFTAILTGIGCPFHCKYCASTLSRCLMRSPANVVDEIEACCRDYGIREIDFYDQSFTINRSRAIAICEEIIRRKIDVIWTIRTRADLVDEALLLIMKKAGLYRIMYGIESGDQEILDRLNKSEKRADIERVVSLTQRHGIAVFGFFMFGCPGETPETLQRTKEFILSMPFDEIQVTRFTLFPGTAFYSEYRERTGARDYWADYTLGRHAAERLPLIDTVYTPETIEREIKYMYLRFYIRPRILWKKLCNGSLIKNFVQYSKAVLDMIVN